VVVQRTDLALDLMVWVVPLDQVDQLDVYLEDHLVDHPELRNLRALEVLEVVLHCCSLEAEVGAH
jgi:hypothetical protein